MVPLATVILNTNDIYALFQTFINQDCMSSEKSMRFYYNWHCSAGAMKISHPKETRPTQVQLNDKKGKSGCLASSEAIPHCDE